MNLHSGAERPPSPDAGQNPLSPSSWGRHEGRGCDDGRLAVAGAAFGVPNPRLVLAAVAVGHAATQGIKFGNCARAATRGQGAVVADIQQRPVAEVCIPLSPGEEPPEADDDDVKPWANAVRIQDGRLVTGTHAPPASLWHAFNALLMQVPTDAS
jgi:hypothetical protein